MAFNLNGFQFYRGTTTSEAQGGGITTVMHSYKSTDSAATISTLGYFPPNIDGSTDKVFVGDLLNIVASDNVILCRILSVDPFTLGDDIYTSGVTLTVIPPTDAIDDNGMIISGTNVQLEFASDLTPGIVSATDQSFGGVKTFRNGIKLPTPGGTPSLLFYYEEGIYSSTFTNDTSTSNSISFSFVRNGKIVLLNVQGNPGSAVTGATPGPVYISNTVLPTPLFPFAGTGGIIQINVGGVAKITTWGTNSLGQVFIYFDPNTTSNFPAATAITFGPGSLTYTAT